MFLLVYCTGSLFVYQKVYCRLGEVFLRFVWVFQNYLGTVNKKSTRAGNHTFLFLLGAHMQMQIPPFFD